MTADRLAFALTGGGARAAYQVGCLRYIARQFPECRPQIVTGISAGAINAAHIASFDGPLPEAVERLRTLWLDLHTNKVYRTNFRHLAWHVLGVAVRLLSGGTRFAPDIRGMVNTSPLRRYLSESLPLAVDGNLSGIRRNLDRGWLEAVAMVTTSYASGRSVIWVEGEDVEPWQRTQRIARTTRLTLDHVMASAALPLFFPAVRIGDEWHGDGGMRVMAPLSPALHLGASRILAVSPRFPGGEPPAIGTLEYPAPAQVAGVMLNSMFLDMLDYDAMQMSRINDLLERLDEPHPELRRVEVLILRPSQDLGMLALEHETQLPRMFRFLERGLGAQEGRSADALSMVLFEHEYLARMVVLGEEDTAARAGELRAFLRADESAQAQGVTDDRDGRKAHG